MDRPVQRAGAMSDIHVIVVEPGTVIKKEGEELVVDERNVVFSGSKMYCTDNALDALKRDSQ